MNRERGRCEDGGGGYIAGEKQHLNPGDFEDRIDHSKKLNTYPATPNHLQRN